MDELQRSRRSTLDRFFKQHHCGSTENLDHRWKQIREAASATRDAAVLRSFSLTAKCLVRLLREIKSAIHAYETDIRELADKHPDFDLLESFPGAGEALIPRLIAAFGTRRDRWANASELHCYSGIAPVLETSGRQRWVYVRWAWPKFVRQTFHEWALHSIAKCEWARAHYEVQIQRGKSRHAAIRSVAFKWIRIAFRCWTMRCRYDPELYQARGSKKPTGGLDLEVQWKACGSFSKIVAAGS